MERTNEQQQAIHHTHPLVMGKIETPFFISPLLKRPPIMVAVTDLTTRATNTIETQKRIVII